MPMGVSAESLREMSVSGLRELHAIASAMVLLTKSESHKLEYSELAELVQAEINVRESAAVTMLQNAFQTKRERERNRSEDNARIQTAKQCLEDKGIDIDVDPKLISEARLYHLATVMEAFQVVASKNPYLTTRASSKVKKSALPSRKLQSEFDEVSDELDTSINNIQKLVDERLEAIRQLDLRARTVAIPGSFQINGALVDYATYIYPGAGAIKYNNARTYLLAPNRTLVHVKDELPVAATPQLAGSYLAALVAGCMTFIKEGGCGSNAGTKTQVHGFLPSGRAFYWWMIGKSNASMQGYAGEIYHVDSGYANSPWKHE